MSCIWSFLEVINRMFLNVTVNVIVNAIDILGVLNGSFLFAPQGGTKYGLP